MSVHPHAGKRFKKKGFIQRTGCAEVAFCMKVGTEVCFRLQKRSSGVGDFWLIPNLYVPEHFSSSLLSQLSVLLSSL